MTPKQIVERLSLPIVAEDDGTYSCPVCDYRQNNYRLGPHMIGHWNEAGIAKKYRPHSHDAVTCPEPDCDFKCRRGTLAGHLYNMHDIERRQATAMARTRGFTYDGYLADVHADKMAEIEQQEAAEKVGQLVLADPEPEPNHRLHTEARPDYSEVSGTDAALAVIMGTANGYVATDLIPDIVNYVDQTRQIVDKIRAK